jgi:hypothetical protein
MRLRDGIDTIGWARWAEVVLAFAAWHSPQLPQGPRLVTHFSNAGNVELNLPSLKVPLAARTMLEQLSRRRHSGRARAAGAVL